MRHIRSLLSIMQHDCVDIIERASAERAQLSTCLDELGCHGLVNCADGRLMHFDDAVRFEMSAHQLRIKMINDKLRKMRRNTSSSPLHHYFIGMKASITSRQSLFIIDDTSASEFGHQRQMSLRLTDVYTRLCRNESIESLLAECIDNVQLTSLMRIVRRRIHCDRMLMCRFDSLRLLASNTNIIIDNDPMLAQLCVQFRNAYDKVRMFVRTKIRDDYTFCSY